MKAYERGEVAHDQIIFAPAPSDTELAGAILTVDLKLLQDNWKKLADECAPAECAATVKGDAYGLGIEPCVRALWAAGCRSFFVALPAEGESVRRVLDEATVYVLDGLFSGQAAYYEEHGLTPCLNSLQEIEEWAKHCSAQQRRLSAALHIDTGINRLGLSPADVEKLGETPALLAPFKLALILSHLACGDDPNAEMNAMQRKRFDALRALLPSAPASLANSPGSFLGAAFACDMIRPGVALYGGNPFAARPNPMSPVVRLYAPVLQVRDVAAGSSVGYGATWQAKRDSKIAVVGIGYRDGYLRSLSYPASDGPAQVMIGGHYCPVVGRVSMDMITVDITDVPPEFIRRGAMAEIMGDNVTVDELARWAGTIPYEILTGLGSRYTRLYSSLHPK